MGRVRVVNGNTVVDRGRMLPGQPPVRLVHPAQA